MYIYMYIYIYIYICHIIAMLLPCYCHYGGNDMAITWQITWQ